MSNMQNAMKVNKLSRSMSVETAPIGVLSTDDPFGINI
jgi:hypothetical protein